jgi:hypothetical protein
MDENVLTAIIWFNEPKALGRVEPFNSACRHRSSSPDKKFKTVGPFGSNQPRIVVEYQIQIQHATTDLTSVLGP